MFYPEGSLKHRLCMEGNVLLHEWAERFGVPLLRCGKLIVAVEPEELPGLERVWAQCLANGVPEVRRVGAEESRSLEPNVRIHEAIWSCRAPTGLNRSSGRPTSRRRNGRGMRSPLRSTQTQATSPVSLVSAISTPSWVSDG